jgi:hypothetical protein
MANARPPVVRPRTRGTSSSIAVAKWLPTICELCNAGYQKSHKKPRSASRDGSLAALSGGEIVRIVSLMLGIESLNRIGIVVHGVVSQQPREPQQPCKRGTFPAGNDQFSRQHLSRAVVRVRHQRASAEQGSEAVRVFVAWHHRFHDRVRCRAVLRALAHSPEISTLQKTL